MPPKKQGKNMYLLFLTVEPNIPSPMAASVDGPPFVAVPSALPSSLFLKRPVTVLECHSESSGGLELRHLPRPSVPNALDSEVTSEWWFAVTLFTLQTRPQSNRLSYTLPDGLSVTESSSKSQWSSALEMGTLVPQNR